MKKAISLILALTLVMGLSYTAFAADGLKDENLDISADYKDQQITDVPAYSVKATWDTPPTLTYDAGAVTYTWNPSTHTYEKKIDKEAGWTDDSAEFVIKVVNNSNRAVTFTAEYTSAAGDVKTQMNWTEQSVTLKSAAPADYTGTGTEQTGELKGTVTVTEGTPSGKVSVGSITVEIKAGN